MTPRARRLHRMVSILFTMTVLANFGVMFFGTTPPPAWVTYAPLLPLAILQISGLYLLVTSGRRRRVSALPGE